MLHAAIVIALLVLPNAQPQEERPASSRSSSQATTTQPAIAFTLEPHEQAKSDDDAYERELADRARRLVDAAEAAAPDNRRAASLKAAGFILGRQCEPPLSRMLLDLSTAADEQTLTDASAQ